MIRLAVAIPALLLAGLVQAGPYNSERAHLNYMLYCQGCHTPDGTGLGSVPKVKDHIGRFLETEKGREYLTRVPGAANSVLKDDKLAEVLNWMILELGGESVPDDFTPYTAAEVGEHRDHPLMETVEYRRQLLEKLAGTDK